MTEIITFSALLVGLLSLGLYFLEYREKIVLQKKFQSMDITPTIAQKKGEGLLRNAIKKAQALLGHAETESIKFIAQSKYEIKDLERKYKVEMDVLEKSLEESIKKTVKERVELGFAGFESQLARVLGDETERFRKAYGDELSRIRESYDGVKTEVESYKQAQYNRVNAEVVGVLEKTLSDALGKKYRLDVDGQTDLVIETLQKAKGEKFI